MFSESVELYDLIYSRLKDYALEADAIARLLRDIHPSAHDLLDVGCGTGEHARHLTGLGFAVDGLDIEPGFVEAARAKSSGEFVVADMASFVLERRYDAVLCLFSSIGYVGTAERLASAIERFATHLRPGGVVVVEPWFEPGQMTDGRVHLHTAQSGDVSVCRMSRTTIDGAISRLEFEYLIGGSAGISRASEVHELGLFRRDEIETCFASVGLSCEYDPAGLTGRGLYVGRAVRAL